MYLCNILYFRVFHLYHRSASFKALPEALWIRSLMMFTDKAIAALKPAEKPYREFEKGADKGFGVQISPAGVKAFFVQYLSPETGKRRFMNLGGYPDTSLANARKQCRTARELVEQGIDPQKRRAELEEQAQAAYKLAQRKGTVQQLFDDYIGNLKAKDKRSWSHVQQTYDLNIKPFLANKKTNEVTPDDIVDVIQRIYKRKANTVARNTQAYLLAAFNFGMRARFDPKVETSAEYMLNSNPVAPIPRADSVNVGERNLNSVEIKILFNELAKTAMHFQTQVALKLILATGQRIEEILGMRKSEINYTDYLWELSASRTKNGLAHVVPLTDMTMSMIRSLDAIAVEDCLFPRKDNAREPMPYHTLSKAVNRFCKNCNVSLAKFVPKDLRRTAKSRMGEIGIEKTIRDRLQNHALNDVSSKHYDRYDYLAEKRAAMQRWNTWLEQIISDEEQSNVVPFASKTG